VPSLTQSMATTDASRTATPLRPWLGIALRALTLLATLAFLAHGLRWHETAGAMRRAGLAVPAVVVALNAVMMILRALRMRILLGPRITLGACFLARLTSSALNNVTPFRGGDVARLWMVERASGVTKSTAAAMGVVESLVEAAVLAALGLVSSFLVAGQRWATVATPLVLCVAVLVLVFLQVTTGRAARSSALAEGESHRRGPRSRLCRFLGRLEPGFRALARPRVSAAVALLSLATWLCEATMVFLCAYSMDLTLSVPLAVIVLVGINLALTLPSTPAGAGPFEGATVAVLMLAGVGKAPAVAFALFYHAIQVIPVTVVGVAILLLKRRRPSGSAGSLGMRALSAEPVNLGAQSAR
jgi:glycosyltransferase 2 family protein